MTRIKEIATSSLTIRSLAVISTILTLNPIKTMAIMPRIQTIIIMQLMTATATIRNLLIRPQLRIIIIIMLAMTTIAIRSLHLLTKLQPGPDKPQLMKNLTCNHF
jgi:hypothetical protein